MRKVILIVSIIVFLLAVLLISFHTTGNAVGSGASGSSGSSGRTDNACGQAPFDSDSGAKICGKGCCFGSQTCYKDEVCCDRVNEVGDSIPQIVYFCTKKCDLKSGQSQCGDVCCNPGEVCALHPDGQPYCYPRQRSVNEASANWGEKFRSFFGWS